MPILLLVLPLLVLLTVILPGGFSGPGYAFGDDNLRLSLRIEFVETSKDSNWQCFTAEIADGTMRLTKEFGGFAAQENESLEKPVTQAMARSILDTVAKLGLDRSVTEDKPTEGLGVSGQLFLELGGSNPITLRVIGRTSIWGTDQGVESNLDNRTLFPAAESLFQFLWTFEDSE